MVTESSFNPLPILVHVIAIALGIFLGLRAMDAIAPDLPAESVEPGISSSTAPGTVAPEDPNSLLLAENLGPALEQLDEQLAAGEGVISLNIQPGSLNAETGSGDGLFAPEDVPTDGPRRLADEINRQRERITLDDFGYVDLVATRRGPQWYVQIDINRTDVDPPWAYTAPLEGRPVTVGPPPTPIAGPADSR